MQPRILCRAHAQRAGGQAEARAGCGAHASMRPVVGGWMGAHFTMLRRSWLLLLWLLLWLLLRLLRGGPARVSQDTAGLTARRATGCSCCSGSVGVVVDWRCRPSCT